MTKPKTRRQVIVVLKTAEDKLLKVLDDSILYSEAGILLDKLAISNAYRNLGEVIKKLQEHPKDRV